jgi:hypothetical protein
MLKKRKERGMSKARRIFATPKTLATLELKADPYLLDNLVVVQGDTHLYIMDIEKGESGSAKNFVSDPFQFKVERFKEPDEV